ncbi:MAG: hypothetical protein GX130_04990 [Candidatus Hydrogenedens sp.]|nr:hypothetical protein [Candidatus Hydrogenedens sp.]
MRNVSSVFCSILLLCLMTGFVFADGLQMAPPDPAFLRWLQQKDSFPGYTPPPAPFRHRQGSSLKGTLPERFDLRDVDGLSPVKNQRNCGACWSFAACGVLESNLKLQSGEVWDFSENHMKNTHGFLWGPCAGGNNYISLAYLARWTGPLLESDDPYDPYGLVPPAEGAERQKLLLRGLHFSLDESGTDAIKNYVYETGPLSATMMWRDQDYDNASRTYRYSGGAGATGHMVVLIGWDDHKAVPGAPGPGAWICRNSWGAGWGEGGYFYISYHDTAFLEDAAGFDEIAPPDAYGTLYHYDPFGITSYAGSGLATDVYGANVFTAVQDETITAIGTYATSDDLSYTIQVYEGGFINGMISNPVVSLDGFFETAGYHVVALPEDVELYEGDVFTVVVRYNSAISDFPLPLEQPIPGFCPATAALGQSYISEDGLFFEDVHGLGGNWRNCNVCIKAIAAYKPVEIPPPSVKIMGRPRVEAGDFVSLRAVISHFAGSAAYAWYKDGELLPSATQQVFTISSVAFEDAGLYVVQVSDGESGVIISPPFTLTVLLEGSLPVYGSAGLLLLLTLFIAVGTVFIRRHALREN